MLPGRLLLASSQGEQRRQAASGKAVAHFARSPPHVREPTRRDLEELVSIGRALRVLAEHNGSHLPKGVEVVEHVCGKVAPADTPVECPSMALILPLHAMRPLARRA